jgi:MinD-like ATPase involved in chromosome partitioning or flagellar assembly
MIRDQIREKVQHNLEEAALGYADIRVRKDPFGAWRIAIVSEGFDGRREEERRAIALRGLENLALEWVDLLTPAEREWAGNLPLDVEIEDLPLWPEALARGAQIGTDFDVLFASDLDDDLPRPIVCSFYSLRGGVGRSTALAYTATLLATKGRKVVCVDMDLEAPGLAALFGREADIRDDQGVVSLLVQIDHGQQPDFANHLIQTDDTLDLYCLPAGRPDASYARRLRFVDPAGWYRAERNPLRELLEGLKKKLPFIPDVILLDSRTGINPLNAPLLFDLADLAIIVFFPHPQARTGTEALVRAVIATKTGRQMDNSRLTPDIRFLVSPIPASRATEVVERYRHRALEWIAEWVSPLNDQRGRTPLLEDDITHFVPYREVLASSDKVLPDSDVWRDFDQITEWIDRFLPTRTEERQPVTLASTKRQILDQLKFAAGTAEQQEDFLETFVETSLVKKALGRDVPLVLGRKGTGKTALFRRLKEDSERLSVIVQAPSHFRKDARWILGPDGFKHVGTTLRHNELGWNQFWSYYTALAIAHTRPGLANPGLASLLGNRIDGAVQSEAATIELLEQIRVNPKFGLMIGDWLQQADSALPDKTVLLFDGLDTGFGGDEADRQLRTEAISGLFSFWMDRETLFDHMSFKLMLREDIWRKLKFENKSHLFGRTVSLKWSEQAPFFKVVLKQALRSPAFRDTLTPTTGGRELKFERLDVWTDDEVFLAWNTLVGERMKGGKTAFTRNWVWNRLADGNDDHSPRYLLQLFHAVSDWEREENEHNPYEKSVMRPRAFAECLAIVSEQALEALKEEFSDELSTLLDRLREFGRTPIPAVELREHRGAVELALEVGLLAIYEGTKENLERYKVPEIYRHSLGMTRKGQM